MPRKWEEQKNMNHFFRAYVAAILILTAVFAPICDAAQTDQATGAVIEKRVKAYEEWCVSSLRVINVAEVTYWGGDSAKGYARTLKELGPAGAGLINAATASGKIEAVVLAGGKNGYRLRLIPERAGANHPIEHYTINARPIKRLVKDQRSFFTDETGVIRFTTENRAATIADPPLDSPPKQ
ncbi:MAG: hypothetical protein WB716_05780 [Candidatus Acidiferrales bacterium]